MPTKPNPDVLAEAQQKETRVDNALTRFGSKHVTSFARVATWGIIIFVFLLVLLIIGVFVQFVRIFIH